MSGMKITSLHGAHLLLTGATGFVGKVVLAELVRRREELGLERIYVLVRGKKDRTAQQRFEKEVVESPAFQFLGDEWPTLCQVVHGELTYEHCDISRADQKTLTTRVTHIIHCAASVDFDLPVAEAASCNITAALNVLTLAQKCARLKHMVSVSTAYVTPWKDSGRHGQRERAAARDRASEHVHVHEVPGGAPAERTPRPCADFHRAAVGCVGVLAPPVSGVD